MISTTDTSERLENEIALVTAMYPDQLSWDPHSRELTFRSTNASMAIRLQDDYPANGRPIIISASAGKRDISGEVKKRLLEDFGSGEEVLDELVMIFDELVAHHALQASGEGFGQPPAADDVSSGDATIIVWLHHLLNTNKRKMALSPAASVSGVTKPGYPGVLVYSGPANAVREHVNELKGQNWAAFQVRLEVLEEPAWQFAHGTGVKEVETMGDVVTEVGEGRKQDFMQAMKIK